MRQLLFLVSIACSLASIAQDDTLQKVYGVAVYTGQVVVHTDAVKNIKGTKPFGAELQMAKHQTGFQIWNHSNAYVKSGWALAYFNFNKDILGHAVIASRFIEPQFMLASKLQFLLRASFGASYLSNPNDAVKNPTNKNYSLYINPYMHIGTGFSYQFSKHVSVAATANFHHISNGNLQQPNKGINWATGALGLYYYPGSNMLPKYKSVTDEFWKNDKVDYRLNVFAVPQQGYNSKYFAQRKWLLGLGIQASRQFTGIDAWTLGAEMYYDNLLVDKEKQPLASKFVVGLQGGHVFLLGKVRFSQQVGYNVYSKEYFIPRFYHRWGLDYQLSKRYSIGANLKANSDNADFFDVRLGIKL